MSLKNYFGLNAGVFPSLSDRDGLDRLGQDVMRGQDIFVSLAESEKSAVLAAFWNKVRTEEIKAWYGEREGDSLFQGTSVSSLTIPAEVENPIDFSSAEDLEHAIADHYIQIHDQHAGTVRSAILEDVENWLAQGLFFGVMVGSKVISQAFGLSVPEDQIVFDVDGVRVDPHEIISYSAATRESYFEKCLERVSCFEGLDLDRKEFEQSLVLADISKPRIAKYRNHLILGPVRCNEIAALISRHVVTLIRDKTNGRISPPSFQVGIYDSDTPYTYHAVSGFLRGVTSPVLPGLTLLGTSGTVAAFRWLYFYRMALIAQKLMKSSLYSEVDRKFIPFVFFGVLVPRDAEILLDMKKLSSLRYRGHISPEIEFLNLVPALVDYIRHVPADSLEADLLKRIQ